MCAGILNLCDNLCQQIGQYLSWSKSITMIESHVRFKMFLKYVINFQMTTKQFDTCCRFDKNFPSMIINKCELQINQTYVAICYKYLKELKLSMYQSAFISLCCEKLQICYFCNQGGNLHTCWFHASTANIKTIIFENCKKDDMIELPPKLQSLILLNSHPPERLDQYTNLTHLSINSLDLLQKVKTPLLQISKLTVLQSNTLIYCAYLFNFKNLKILHLEEYCHANNIFINDFLHFLSLEELYCSTSPMIELKFKSSTLTTLSIKTNNNDLNYHTNTFLGLLQFTF